MKAAPPDLPHYVAIVDAATETGLPYTTLRTAGYNGEFPVLKLGKEGSKRESWYVKRSDLLAWLERRTQTAPPTRGRSRMHVA